MKFKALEAAEILKAPNKDLDGNADTPLLKGKDNENTAIEVSPSSYIEDSESQIVRPLQLDYVNTFFSIENVCILVVMLVFSHLSEFEFRSFNSFNSISDGEIFEMSLTIIILL